ncbi:cytochrome d ubiquinol oxidase subunit II [Campylobacter hepaticus]|uniref:cytochrome d ubiquinol oxidase subunit II n=1 Tax=Campylobacter hepaticus TaxID=1813019 RepID=UPI0018C19335|nr:cytochrome d ubiquinol oxidase subunit II [Campylobacter hepaticus]MDX2331249.1 cytochrome d ubiquinol oxidase subunit II [Campylobacter hepaticus]MDX2371864.1 cytochrome d ubiquinol oxidase subunit II [Campylobacter hepaticus]MDX2397755.1 cytochrome d ubiquinol oxidase subunit II [Campylobacter hepaticus]MDX5509022.1 cytochrome d ubiquinol oxidase subunit II [Campylobacter hepaticus]QOW63864.1 cytochrome d ubiquinol oxidase subunit II [Campylobacter hepaticus]
MFFGLELQALQIYWWLILSLLGGLLVFMFFVQGGQTLIDELSENELEKTMLINSLGRKWELGFTTFVLFGGAAFAAFPLFYSTSFGGAYWIWLCILFCFILQAIAYEYRKKENNIYGLKTYEIFLKINGYLGVFLIGIVISSFFSGLEFTLNENNFVFWQNSLHGLELLFNPFNYFLALALIFLARLLGAAYFMNNINDENIKIKAMKKLTINGILFLPFFLAFLVWIFIKDGFGVDKNGFVSLSANLYLYNFLNASFLAILFLMGIVLVLLGVFEGSKGCSKAIFTLGLGTVLTVFSLLSSLGLGESAFYPSLKDLQSSLTLKNASSSYYTLSVMAYVSLLVPFVLTYIIYVWRAMDRIKITREEMENNDHTY